MWTPEGWEWGKMNADNPEFQKSISDLGDAMAARDAVNPGLQMATNGWVVGPLPDRAVYDRVLPTSWDAIASIDLNTGHSPVDPAYQNVTRHAKWVIPWMEDDPDMTAPQLWVNRTLQHMEDAKTYGASGLLGIHWRTRAISPQIAAMAQKSWQPELKSGEFWGSWCTSTFGPISGHFFAPYFSHSLVVWSTCKMFFASSLTAINVAYGSGVCSSSVIFFVFFFLFLLLRYISAHFCISRALFERGKTLESQREKTKV